MGSLPPEHVGVGSATNGTFLHVGGAVGVATVGSLMATRYADRLATFPALAHLAHPVHQAVTGSLGGALTVAAHLPQPAGSLLATAARTAFVSGMDLGLMVGAIIAIAGALVALVALPAEHAAH